MSTRKAVTLTLVIVLAIAAVALGLAYRSIVSGGSIARNQDPPALEITVAQWLLHRSVPESARQLKNPLSAAADSADVAQGRELFRKKCEICHAYDGGGRTDIGSGEYPRPIDLHSPDVQHLSDGEIFYHIKNGVRHTGMPGWGLPDRHLWQLVAYLRNLPKIASLEPAAAAARSDTVAPHAEYTGSGACKECHADIYARWSKTRMANVVRDPREHPDAIIPDLAKPNPLVTFSLADIAFVYGSKWKQRYFKRIGDDYFVLPAIWYMTH
jgi:mono/diheme cytochrome c family protein